MKNETLQMIHKQLTEADAMLILTGAGMGVDSGLSDYRGKSGQWGKVADETKLNAIDVVNPQYMEKNPGYVWELFARRMKEYQQAIPHQGFHILKQWIEKFTLDYFIITSNIDAQFQKAGFNEQKIRELHGSIFYLQCSKPCTNEIWTNNLNSETLIDEIKSGLFPKCPNCGAMARPNVYMFRDGTYIAKRSKNQDTRFEEFMSHHKNEKFIVFEIGSGPHVQSIRKKTRNIRINHNAFVVRINPKNAKIKPPHIAIDTGALEALSNIDNYIRNYHNK